MSWVKLNDGAATLPRLQIRYPDPSDIAGQSEPATSEAALSVFLLLRVNKVGG